MTDPITPADPAPAAPGADPAAAPISSAMNKGGTPPATPATPASPEFKIPEQFANEEWAKNIKGPEDLFNQFANSQKLLGKKGVIVPGENATEAEIAAYHKALGVPDSEDGYEFKIPEGIDAKPNEAEEKMVRTLMRKHGIPKKSAEGFVADYRKATYEAQAESLKQAKARDEEFDGYVKNVFGEDKDVKVSEFKEVARKTLDPKFHALIEKMDNPSAVLLMGLVENIHSKYGKPGTFLDPKNPGNISARTQAAIVADLTALHTKYNKARPQTPEYFEYVKRESELKAELDLILNKK